MDQQTTLAIIIIASIAIYLGYNRRCPKCKKWFCKKKNGTEIIGENKKHETITREDIHKDKDGKEIGRTERKEQILVKYTDYRNYHFCKKCGYKWTTTTCERKEL